MAENVILGGFVALSLFLLLSMVHFVWRQRRRRQPQNWRRLVLGNTLVFLWFCSIALVGGELYYRFVYDTTDGYGLSKTTINWFGRHFQFNKEGFRDSVNYDAHIEPGRRRVTFLGDSFSVGHGVANVEDRFANRFRAMGIVDEVHMLGQNGFDTGNELFMLDELITLGYQFDVVVLVYCLNDISDILPEWNAILNQIYAAPSPGILVEESYLLNKVYHRWRVARDPMIADYFNFIDDAYSGPDSEWKQQKLRLRQVHKKVRDHGGQLLVVTFPFLQDLGPDYRYEFIHELLDQYWKDEGVPHLDLLSLFEAYDASSLIVNPHDPHPNEFAHKLAAEAMAEFLEAQLQSDSPDSPQARSAGAGAKPTSDETSATDTGS